jgi:hypothetical protein
MTPAAASLKVFAFEQNFAARSWCRRIIVNPTVVCPSRIHRLNPAFAFGELE